MASKSERYILAYYYTDKLMNELSGDSLRISASMIQASQDTNARNHKLCIGRVDRIVTTSMAD